MNSILLKNPAKSFKEALPIGNGRLGAKVYGNVGHEVIALNEESVWSSAYKGRINKSASKEIKNIKNLVKLERYSEAQELVFESLTGISEFCSNYESAGSIHIDFYDEENSGLKGPDSYRNLEDCLSSSYSHELDMSSGIITTSYTKQSKVASTADFAANTKESSCTFTREAFVSSSGDCLVIHITASLPKSIYLRARFENPNCYRKYAYTDDTVVMEDSHGIPFIGMMTAITSGGKVKTRGDNLIVEKADEVTLYIDIQSAYRNKKYFKKNGNTKVSKQTFFNWLIDKALKNICFVSSGNYVTLRENQINEFGSNYSKIDLVLTEPNETVSSLDEIIAKGKNNKELCQLYWNYCHYLLISSSNKPGTLPPLVNGLWYDGSEDVNERRYNFDANQNSFMPGACSSLSYLDSGYFNLLKRFYKHGREVASNMYSSEGFVGHSSTDIWGDACPCGTDIRSSYKMLGSLNACFFVLAHYEYTQNKSFLKKNYKFLRDACKFFTYYMDSTDDKSYVLTPGFTNGYDDGDGNTLFIAKESNEEMLLIKKLYDETLKAASYLKKNENSSEIIEINVIDRNLKFDEKKAGKDKALPLTIKDLDGKAINDFTAMTNSIINAEIEDNVVKIKLLANLPKEWDKGALTGVTIKGNLVVDISWEEGNLKSAKVYRKTGSKSLNQLEINYRGITCEGRISGNELDLFNLLPSTVE